MQLTATKKTIIDYPIAGNDSGGTLFCYHQLADDEKKLDHIVFFCAGFPDDYTVFVPFATRILEELKKEGLNALVGITTLAGFDHYEPKRYLSSFRPEGYNLAEWTSSLRNGIKTFKTYATETYEGNPRFTAVYHDFGVLSGVIATNQAIDENDALTRPDQIVLFDVFPVRAHPKESNKPKAQKKSIMDTVRQLLYRFIYAASFVIQRFSPLLGGLFTIVAHNVLESTTLYPLGSSDSFVPAEHFKKRGIKGMAYITFPYFYIMKAVFGGKKVLKQTFGGFHLPLLSQTPVLFLYGFEKHSMFHDANLAKFLTIYGEEHKTKTKSRGLANAGHWLYVQEEQECVHEVKKFLLAP